MPEAETLQLPVHMQVPAYFDSKQKAAIIAAGTMAGLDKVRLVRSERFHVPAPALLLLQTGFDS